MSPTALSPSASPASAGISALEQHVRAARGVGNVTLRYTGIGPFTARGARTGRLYACGGAAATLHVDPADAEALLRSRLFIRPRG